MIVPTNQIKALSISLLHVTLTLLCSLGRFIITNFYFKVDWIVVIKSLTKSYHRPPGLIRSFCLGPPFLSGKTWGTCAVTVDPVDLDVFVTSDSFLWFFFSFFALFSSWSFLRLSLDFTAVPALLSWLISSSLLDNNQWKQFKIKLFIITDPQSTPYLLTGKIVSLQVMHDGYLVCQEGINLNFYQDTRVIFFTLP